MRSPLRRALRWILAALAVTVAACGSSEPGPALSLPPPSSLPTSKTSHAIVVVMENKEYHQVIGSRHAPYTNSLARRYASVGRLFALRHPSLPNYLGLTGGSTFGVRSDCSGCNVNAQSVADQLERGGFTWKAYMQGMPHACYRGSSTGGYAKKHDPFMYYEPIRRDPRRCARVVPYARLGRDLRAGQLPDFAFISPDLCNDTHDCGVEQGDRFLRRVVPALLRELGPHGILFLTWDEGESDRGCCGLARGGHIATVVAGPDVRRGAGRGGQYTLYSILRTIDEAFGLPPLGKAADPRTRSLAALFTRPPSMRRSSRAP